MTCTLNHETQQRVAPAGAMLYLAEPYSLCTRGFCRKAWLPLVLSAHGELSKCHELLSSCPATNLDLTAVPVQILRGNSLNQTSMYSTSNPIINYTGTNQLFIFGKKKKNNMQPTGDIAPAEWKWEVWKTGVCFLYGNCFSSMNLNCQACSTQDMHFSH